jgi:hypothetical protein
VRGPNEVSREPQIDLPLVESESATSAPYLTVELDQAGQYVSVVGKFPLSR